MLFLIKLLVHDERIYSYQDYEVAGVRSISAPLQGSFNVEEVKLVGPRLALLRLRSSN